ncbi:coiled-coil domain-containing protein 30 isoform X3 [Denticeps clupeoides]|uniref:coiled-coil domain-containing protein 30 isoform X3 n=1 Tax=Denticeps clupeoides TaxID=299321 RepID=UPI0010A4F734|nr:coiled-coil domain-containing protein 30-like isoform X3 [Denticeps clupeoides]
MARPFQGLRRCPVSPGSDCPTAWKSRPHAAARLNARSHQTWSVVVEEISQCLQNEGVPSGASPEQRQAHLWHLLEKRETELETLRTQQATEMTEVESYVEHIRNLLEERECLTAEYERDNEHLRSEVTHMKQQQETQFKELLEMLLQEGLSEISHSSPSEQVAYLLVERATMLERLETVEKKLDTQTLTGNLREVHLEGELEHTRQTLTNELRQQREEMQLAKEKMSKDLQSPGQNIWRKFFGFCKATQNIAAAHSEELLKERRERQKVERDLDEAACRLTMAHEEIRHLHISRDSSCSDGQELLRAKEHQEELVLHDCMHHLDRKKLLEMQDNGLDDSLSPPSEIQDLHKRCRSELEDKDCRLRDLQRRLQKLQLEQEELVERNEELEALLGEAQNRSRAEHECHECELEGLKRKIKTLEEEIRIKTAVSDEDHKGQPCMLKTDSGKAQEDLIESRIQVSKLQTQVDQLKSDMSCLQRDNTRLKAEIQEKISLVELKKHQVEAVEEMQQRMSQGLTQQGRKLGPVGRSQTQHGYAVPTSASAADLQQCDLNQLETLRLEVNRLHCTLDEERDLANQHQLALQTQIAEAQARAKSQDSFLEQKSEELKQLKQDLQRTQGLFSSSERELRYEREKNLDLKRHNSLLEQEKLKICAELKQAQAKVSDLEQRCTEQTAELERLQQQSRELQLQLARGQQSRKAVDSLQEELNEKRDRLITTDKKVLELQQELRNALHQLRLQEACLGESSRTEQNSRDLLNSLRSVKASLQEEQLQRKLVEQREEQLQQQLHFLRGKEAVLSRTNAELSHRSQELETRLQVSDSEQRVLREEERQSQANLHKLQEELISGQQERNRFQEELQHVMQQLDTNIRKYSEKQAVHKAKLRQAKLIFTKATTQRDRTIQKLEKSLTLVTSVCEKEKLWICTVTEENEKLLMEKRELLQQLTEAEEMGNNGLRAANNVQQRVSFLELENSQLQEQILKLTSEVGILERTVRNLEGAHSLEDLKKMHPLDCLLQTSSLKAGMSDPLGFLDAISMKMGETVDSAVSVPADVSYLNVVSTRTPGCYLEQQGSCSTDEE